ncbi:ephrin-B2-like isoform X2 [Ptychodera flava]|uniref:ephrin-B2-like isoform X2 n=1 Tax=Ptychodera flava TaxID=63121 RepID=UPI003969F6F0
MMLVPVILLLLAICAQYVCSVRLDPIPWDSSKVPEGGWYIEANLFDQLDFVCPRVANNSMERDRAQYNVIYEVPKKGLEECDATVEGSRILHVCDDPFEENKYSFFFTYFSPIPGDLIFESGREYHFITVGDDTRNGLNNKKGGNCLEKDMKATIKICCGSPSSSSPNHTPDRKTEASKTESGNKKPQSDYSTTGNAHQTLAYGLLIVVMHIFLSIVV